MGMPLSNGSGELPARDFLRRRFFRIFPSYWMALALFVVLGTAFRHRVFTLPDILLHVAGLHATFRGAYFSDINDSFWFITTIATSIVQPSSRCAGGGGTFSWCSERAATAR